MSTYKAKILVYDNNQFFYKYFKKVFTAYEFKFFSEDEIDEDLEMSNLVIFIMERPIEFIEFFRIYNKGIPIVFGTSEKNFYNRRHEMETICDLKLIDMSGTKMDVKQQLKTYLEAVL